MTSLFWASVAGEVEPMEIPSPCPGCGRAHADGKWVDPCPEVSCPTRGDRHGFLFGLAMPAQTRGEVLARVTEFAIVKGYDKHVLYVKLSEVGEHGTIKTPHFTPLSYGDMERLGLTPTSWTPLHEREPTAWAVICPVHRQVFLTREEYEAQMDDPNALWKCPCGRQATWDDDNYERHG